MIAHTMTHEQMVLDARKDIQMLRNQCIEPLRKLRRERLENGSDTLVHLFRWKSPNRNNWLILIRHSTNRTLIHSLTWFHDRDGRLAALWTTGAGISYYIEPSVFTRFGERSDPDETPMERLQSFFLENHLYSFEPTGRITGHRFQVSIGANQGLGLGEWDPRTDIIHWRTFENQENAMERMDRDHAPYTMNEDQRQHLIALAGKHDPQLASFLKGRPGKAA